MVQSQKPKINLKKTYIAFIRNSVGARSYRNFYAKHSGREQDLLKKGELSCAFFVSSVLKVFELIGRVHLTVAGAQKDLESSGWIRRRNLKKIKPGDIIIWEQKKFSDGSHAHIGFFMGSKQAISSSASKKIIVRHHYIYRGKRSMQAAYYHQNLR